jgi:hypothetical protein
MADVIRAVSGAVDAWQAARAALAEIERAEHPDITDRLGRVWTWMQGEVYTHCGMAYPGGWVAAMSKPANRYMLDNPNYDLCDLCLAGQARNITVCKPERHCSHRACEEARRG